MSDMPVSNPSPTPVPPSTSKGWIPMAILLLLIVVASFGYVWLRGNKALLTQGIGNQIIPQSGAPKISSFASEAEMKAYLEKSQELTQGFGGGFLGGMRDVAISEIAPMPALMESAGEAKTNTSSPSRVSETNVQVKGIDEPDIVKTDGKNLFVSRTSPYYLMEKSLPPTRIDPGFEVMPTEAVPSIVAPDYFPQPVPTSETSIITALPIRELRKSGKIEANGDLLLYKNYLLIFSGQVIHGYNVADSQNPSSVWEKKLDDRQEIVTSRLMNGKVYLVTRTQVNYGNPCPVPLFTGSDLRAIACTSIYYPVSPAPVDVTYTASLFDPQSGVIEKTVSFLGSYDSSVVYMSADALFITYSFSGDTFKILSNFYEQKGKDLLTPDVINKLKQLASYDISVGAKMTELQTVLDRYQQSLSDDERLRVQNETTNRMESYLKEHGRELEKTGIVKVNLANFQISSTGEISGKPLNQFSLDEYKGNLRIATTFGGSWWGFGGGSAQSASDVYVLDNNLRQLGVVTDLGVTERIYSVRFIEDRGYVVTFRQTDPFYVLDLSNPNKPLKTGELKIPGFSSYLHQLEPNRILGVGQENGKVKLSLFNVTDPANPTEMAKYSLDDYWTEVSNNHHAFLQDEKHQIFFLPGGQGGYVFSYSGNTLTLKKAVSEQQVKRAVFINDYLYLVGEQSITVLDENSWEMVNTLSL